MSERKITRGEAVVFAMDVINHAFDDGEVTGKFDTGSLVTGRPRRDWRVRAAFVLAVAAIAALMVSLLLEGAP